MLSSKLAFFNQIIIERLFFKNPSRYSLSDGQHRQELITFDDDDNTGISVRGK